jgi:uncharacterized membrane protein (UPF0127 family)
LVEEFRFMRSIRVVNRTRNTIVGDKIELADTSLTRMWGLLGRTGLGAGGGLWIAPSSGVHTMGMKFPIDVVGLDRNKRVVKLWHSLVPYRVTSVSMKIGSVIELASGEILRAGIELGDELAISDAPN